MRQKPEVPFVYKAVKLLKCILDIIKSLIELFF